MVAVDVDSPHPMDFIGYVSENGQGWRVGQIGLVACSLIADGKTYTDPIEMLESLTGYEKRFDEEAKRELVIEQIAGKLRPGWRQRMTNNRCNRAVASLGTKQRCWFAFPLTRLPKRFTIKSNLWIPPGPEDKAEVILNNIRIAP